MTCSNQDAKPTNESPDTLIAMKLNEYPCSFCSKIYHELWQLKAHWQVVHGIDKERAMKMKAEVEEKRKTQIKQLHCQMRMTRRSTGASCEVSGGPQRSAGGEGTSEVKASNPTTSSPKPSPRSKLGKTSPIKL